MIQVQDCEDSLVDKKKEKERKNEKKINQVNIVDLTK